MGHITTPSIPSELVRIFPSQWIRTTAKECGAAKRFRCVEMVALFWCLVMAPTVGACTSLADMQRLFQAMGSVIVCPSSFQRRFHDGLARFLMACIRRAVECQSNCVHVARIFDPFKDVLLLDSTLMTLSDCLQHAFPGSRKNTHPASAKLNAIYSVAKGSIHSVIIAAGTKSEMKMRRFGTWMKDNLLLMDLGYYNHGIFERIDNYLGSFISRLHPGANPIIVSENLTGPGRRRRLSGKKIKSVLRGLKREVLDVNIKVSCKRKGNGGVTIHTKKIFRVVGIYNEEARKYHLYITNLNSEQMEASEIAAIYGTRWVVELVFHELKNRYAMAPKIAKKKEVARCLILVAVLNLIVSRAILELLRRRLLNSIDATGRFERHARSVIKKRTPELRFAAMFAVFGPLLLPDVLRAAGLQWNSRHLEELMMIAMLDPNRKRERLFDKIERLGR